MPRLAPLRHRECHARGMQRVSGELTGDSPEKFVYYASWNFGMPRSKVRFATSKRAGDHQRDPYRVHLSR